MRRSGCSVLLLRKHEGVSEPAATEIEIGAERAFADARVVDLVGSAIAARLIEIPAAREDKAVVADLAADHEIGGGVGNAGCEYRRCRADCWE